MEIKVTILNVKDGDAIIVELVKPNKTLIMVIDGGESGYYKIKVQPRLKDILKIHKKAAPDIVVCTHFDSDHIGGLIPLIQEYISDIQEVWVYKTPEALKEYIEKAVYLLNEQSKPAGDFGLHSYNNLFEGVEQPKKKSLEVNANLILESLSQLKQLLALIPKDKLRQPFHKEQPLPEWKEITVLGPTKGFFNQLFPTTKTFENFIKEEAEGMLLLERSKTWLQNTALVKIPPCDLLKIDTEAKITATNKASIIISIDNEDKRYLFTGDAGVESFKNIPDWKQELKDLYFLKIPHHGSNNNLTKELAELMKPVYAYNTGFKYQDDEVLGCLASKERNNEVKSTKTDDDLFFDK